MSSGRNIPSFKRNLLSPSSELPDDAGSKFLQNISTLVSTTQLHSIAVPKACSWCTLLLALKAFTLLFQLQIIY